MLNFFRENALFSDIICTRERILSFEDLEYNFDRSCSNEKSLKIKSFLSNYIAVLFIKMYAFFLK